MPDFTDAIGKDILGEVVTLYFRPAAALAPNESTTFFPTVEGKVVHITDTTIVLEHDPARTVVYSLDHIVGIGVDGYIALRGQAYMAQRFQSGRK